MIHKRRGPGGGAPARRSSWLDDSGGWTIYAAFDISARMAFSLASASTISLYWALETADCSSRTAGEMRRSEQPLGRPSSLSDEILDLAQGEAKLFRFQDNGKA